jgi:hypothetical protein
MKPFNILVTAGSRRVPLVQSFRAALRSLGLPGVVIVTDVNPLSPAVHVADRAYRVPMSSDAGYLDEVRAICDAEHVRLIVPTIDDELPIFAAARGKFTADGVNVACSPAPTNLLCKRQADHLPAPAGSGCLGGAFVPRDRSASRHRAPAVHQTTYGSWRRRCISHPLAP